MDYSNLFVCLMGMGTVFFGLICLIVLTAIMGRVCGLHRQAAPAAADPVLVAGENRQELVAAVSAALAEELGIDITGIRILSIKRV